MLEYKLGFEQTAPVENIFILLEGKPEFLAR